MDWKRVSGMWGSLQRIHRQLQFGLLITEQVQSLSSLTIQQLASMSRVDENSTLSLALVCSVSAGSGKAFPTDSCFTPLRQQRLSTLMVPSLLREQVATVFSQFLSKQQGITACSYHGPRYLATSTQGTVLGGSFVRLEIESVEMSANCQVRTPIKIGINTSAALFIILFYIIKLFATHIFLQQKMIRKMGESLESTLKQQNAFFQCHSAQKIAQIILCTIKSPSCVDIADLFIIMLHDLQ